MFDRLNKFFARHVSALLIVLGGAGLLITGTYSAYIFNSKDFYSVSIFISFIVMFYPLSLLGVEQGLLRLSTMSDKVFIPRDVFLYCLISIIFSYLIAALLIYQLNIYQGVYLIFLLPLLMSFSLFLSSICRLEGSFFFAQILVNSWKIILIPSMVFSYFLFESTYNGFLIVYTFFSSFILLFCLYIVKKRNYKIIDSKSKGLRLIFGFSLSLLVICMISSGDRAFFGYFYDSVLFSKYAYLSTIYYMPFLIVSSYVGFRALREFKLNPSLLFYKESLKKAYLYAMASIFAFIVLNLILDIFLSTHLKFYEYIFLNLGFILMGGARVVYSVYSAAMGATGSARTIEKCNFFSIFILLMSATLMYVFDIDWEYFVFLYSVNIILRTVFYHYYLGAQYNEIS